ncbi:MAG: GntR family transcriptional regulator [Stappiaceae bacterium]
MGIQVNFSEGGRRTSADDVFDRLRADIVNLRLVPGTKLSEVEVAKQSDVSRQPVREAFIRLSNMNLLQIRPQKATLVRKISIQDILNTRFIRTAVEVEVVRTACENVEEKDLNLLRENLKLQKKAVADGDGDLFHDLDYAFHKGLCLAAKCEFAFKTIAENKSHVDRLCMLGLADNSGMKDLYRDHCEIFDALRQGEADTIVSLTRQHLMRLDTILDYARTNYSDYFED